MCVLFLLPFLSTKPLADTFLHSVVHSWSSVLHCLSLRRQNLFDLFDKPTFPKIFAGILDIFHRPGRYINCGSGRWVYNLRMQQ